MFWRLVCDLWLRRTFELNYAELTGDRPGQSAYDTLRICTKFDMGHLRKGNFASTFVDRLRGHGSTISRILLFSSDLGCRC